MKPKPPSFSPFPDAAPADARRSSAHLLSSAGSAASGVVSAHDGRRHDDDVMYSGLILPSLPPYGSMNGRQSARNTHERLCAMPCVPHCSSAICIFALPAFSSTRRARSFTVASRTSPPWRSRQSTSWDSPSWSCPREVRRDIIDALTSCRERRSAPAKHWSRTDGVPLPKMSGSVLILKKGPRMESFSSWRPSLAAGLQLGWVTSSLATCGMAAKAHRARSGSAKGPSGEHCLTSWGSSPSTGRITSSRPSPSKRVTNCSMKPPGTLLPPPPNWDTSAGGRRASRSCRAPRWTALGGWGNISAMAGFSTRPA
mmetsp:Transcript_16569/g.56485  ORF Transcript_16569/g.56485 Transcript_16569/m.56485 type:complete len:313 (-) Transcript_16569:409-1347(-)